MEPIIASDNAETALVPHGEKVDDEEELSEEYSSEEEEEEDFPPGPVDPEKCTVGGPGTTGGAAQVRALMKTSSQELQYRWQSLCWDQYCLYFALGKQTTTADLYSSAFLILPSKKQD